MKTSTNLLLLILWQHIKCFFYYFKPHTFHESKSRHVYKCLNLFNRMSDLIICHHNYIFHRCTTLIALRPLYCALLGKGGRCWEKIDRATLKALRSLFSHSKTHQGSCLGDVRSSDSQQIPASRQKTHSVRRVKSCSRTHNTRRESYDNDLFHFQKSHSSILVWSKEL